MNGVLKFPTNLIFTLAVLIISAGCKEEPPFIDLSRPVQKLLDTNYIVSPVPAVQDKKVLLEDISGVKCVNCPDAAAKADELKALHGEKLVVVTLMPDKSLLANFTDPDPDYAQVSNPQVTQLLNSLNPPSAMPLGMINRTNNGNGLMVVYQRWPGDVQTELNKPNTVNIEIETSYDNGNRQLLVTAIITYTEDQTDSNQSMSIVLTESNIFGKQKKSTGDDKNYEFKHVARDFATNPTGDPLPKNLSKGRQIKRQYAINVLPNWDIAHCEVVVLVHSSANKVVYQVAEKKAI